MYHLYMVQSDTQGTVHVMYGIVCNTTRIHTHTYTPGPTTRHIEYHLSIHVQLCIQCTVHTQHINYNIYHIQSDICTYIIYTQHMYHWPTHSTSTKASINMCSIRDTVYTHNTCITGQHTTHQWQYLIYCIRTCMFNQGYSVHTQHLYHWPTHSTQHTAIALPP